MARIDASGVEPDILVDRDGTIFAIRITNQAEVVALIGFRKMPLLVARREAMPSGQNPNLEEVNGINP
jgi:hypothetical protein